MTDVGDYHDAIAVPIPAGATGLSGEIEIRRFSLFAVYVPADWITATAITFQAANTSGGTFFNVYDDAGNEVSVTVAASRAVSLDSVALKLAPFRYIKIRSGTAASAVNQTNSPTLALIAKG
jgi:hypothetical protein